MKAKTVLRKIAGRLSGIHRDDLSTAERQIARLLTEAGLLQEDEAGHVIEKTDQQALASMTTPELLAYWNIIQASKRLVTIGDNNMDEHEPIVYELLTARGVWHVKCERC